FSGVAPRADVGGLGFTPSGVRRTAFHRHIDRIGRDDRSSRRRCRPILGVPPAGGKSHGETTRQRQSEASQAAHSLRVAEKRLTIFRHHRLPTPPSGHPVDLSSHSGRWGALWHGTAPRLALAPRGSTMNAAKSENDVVIEAWNTILFDKFCRFQHLLTKGLSHH